MSPNIFRKHLFALFFAFLLALAPIVSAQPPDPNEYRQLPPVNYIRSRVVDVKHVAVDLRFDWDKEQAYGSTVVTLAPFKDTNKIYLDAAAMTSWKTNARSTWQSNTSVTRCSPRRFATRR